MNTYSQYSDIHLITLIGADDRKAFDAIYARHWEALYRSAFYLLHDRDASMDIVQDIFTWLWQKRERLQIQSLPSYLKAAVRFKVANHIRSGTIRDSFFTELAKVDVNPHNSPEELLEVHELRSIITQVISDLPEKCRAIFSLSRDEQLSNQQIADRLQISVKTVEAQMTIALKRIRQAAEPYIIAYLLTQVYHFG